MDDRCLRELTQTERKLILRRWGGICHVCDGESGNKVIEFHCTNDHTHTIIDVLVVCGECHQWFPCQMEVKHGTQ